MPDDGLTANARKVLTARLKFCEQRKLAEGAAFYRHALRTWRKADFDDWARIDDLSAHPRDQEELERFRSMGLTGLGEKDIR